MTPHTPGPWKDISDKLTRRTTMPTMAMVATGAGIRAIDCTGSGATYPEDQANARLIAAAPDLLAACVQAAKLAWEVGCESEDGVLTLLDDSRGDLYRQLSAAIAKAKGNP